MKMPRRPFYPTEQRPDIFGLQRITLLGQAWESETDRKQRIAKVETGVANAFKAAVNHLGEEQARQLFARVVRRPKRGRGKALAPDRDFRLLKAYDESVQNGESLASLAKRLRSAGIELGNTQGAIVTQIRKLVKERKKREHAAKFEARRWRMATRGETSLLSRFIREK